MKEMKAMMMMITNNNNVTTYNGTTRGVLDHKLDTDTNHNLMMKETTV